MTSRCRGTTSHQAGFSPVLALPRSPNTNTTITAVYAAVAAKMESRAAPVETFSPTASTTMKAMTRSSLTSGSVTMYNANIGPISSGAAMGVLHTFASRAK